METQKSKSGKYAWSLHNPKLWKITSQDTKIKYCKKCRRFTNHLKVGFRKPLEEQRWRCLICGEEK